jgi:acetoin utilization protein AcuB
MHIQGESNQIHIFHSYCRINWIIYKEKETAMFVGSRMKHPVITIGPKTSLDDALSLMNKEHIRRLPVVDQSGSLVGIVTELDLLKASPSAATSLSVWEIKSLLSSFPVEKIMTRDVFTVTEDMPLEEAARIMSDHKIGGMPVVRGESVVGIITETDIFNAFLEVLGAREAGLRLTVELGKGPGILAKLSQAIFETGGNILSTGSFLGEDSKTSQMVFRIEGVNDKDLLKAIKPFVSRVVDIRDCAGC